MLRHRVVSICGDGIISNASAAPSSSSAATTTTAAAAAYASDARGASTGCTAYASARSLSMDWSDERARLAAATALQSLQWVAPF